MLDGTSTGRWDGEQAVEDEWVAREGATARQTARRRARDNERGRGKRILAGRECQAMPAPYRAIAVTFAGTYRTPLAQAGRQ